MPDSDRDRVDRRHLAERDPLFLLSAQRGGPYEEMLEHSRRYEQYLASNRDRFPPSAYALATSGWYFDFRESRCPHDAWLEELRIVEPSEGSRQERRTVAIRVKLLGGYHDGYIEFHYPRVFAYELQLTEGTEGHVDWRYDEFRLSDSGRLLHEIEWASMRDTARWVIEASDVEFRFTRTSPHPHGHRELR